MYSDPISDYLTRLRNGIMANKRVVEIPSSNMKVEISKILIIFLLPSPPSILSKLRTVLVSFSLKTKIAMNVDSKIIATLFIGNIFDPPSNIPNALSKKFNLVNIDF